MAVSGAAPDGAGSTRVPVSDRVALIVSGQPRPLPARLLHGFAAQAGAALDRDRLRTQAAQAEALAEGNRMRTALLAAVSHDLRTPLASIKASVSTLRADRHVVWTEADEEALLASIEDGADRLDALIGNLLDIAGWPPASTASTATPTIPVVVFDRDGNFLFSWGAGMFWFPHAIRCSTTQRLRLAHRRIPQPVHEVHDRWRAAAHHRRQGPSLRYRRPGRRFQLDGLEEGDAWRRAVQPADRHRLRADGEMFMSDGYGNARVHKFSPQASTCFRGASRGPHQGSSTCRTASGSIGRGRLLVADRENDRVQVFDQDGNLLEVWPTELIGPAFFYVDADDIVYIPEHNGGMVSVLTLDGERLARWGDPINRSCHGIWCDSRQDIYVVQPGDWGRVRRVVKYTRQ